MMRMPAWQMFDEHKSLVLAHTGVGFTKEAPAFNP